LTLSVFNQDAHFQAEMLNCSQDGVCAQTCQRILPGTSLHVRVDASKAGTLAEFVLPELRTTALGEVKWCRSLNDPSSQQYLIGIRYYPYY
jgi:hypothetical protein